MNGLGEQLALLPGYLSAHLQLTLLALFCGVLTSIPLGILITRTRRPIIEQSILGTASVLQTIPSLALLAFLVPLLAWLGLHSIGFLPAVIGLFLYSLLPVLRNTVTGLTAVDPMYIEAARGVGMTARQQLWQVELPLSMPMIIAGIRTAAVWTVGTATLATPVGAASLGSYIFSGLQTRNYIAVLTGCVASALLALLLDALVRGIELALQRRKRWLLWLSLGGWLGLCAAAIVPLFHSYQPTIHGSHPQAGKQTAPIRIGAKNFTEQYILSRILALKIAQGSGRSTQLVESLGSTVVFDALRNGEIDVYVDYSGTLWANILKRGEPPAERRALLNEVRAALRTQYGLAVAATLGFENAYALAMRQEDSTRLNIHTVSQLAALTKTQPLRIGSDYEFFQRPEWAALKRAYDLEFTETRNMDPSLMYEALRTKQIDIISGFSTDGRIASYGLIVLDDDRHVILPYDALVLIRPGLAQQQPEVVAALRTLDAVISPQQMRQMNADVDQRGQTPQSVAARFLSVAAQP